MSNIRINEIPLILDVDISEDDSFLFLDDETAETTRIKLSQLNSFIASSLTVTASNITNFTEDVRAQFTAGTNITIVDGVISSTAGGGSGDVTETGDNTFSGVNTFTTNYITASAGITGSTALFTSITADGTNLSNLAIGEAEDGDYTDGLFTDFTSATKVGHAIDKINEGLIPNIIISDIRMPDIDGISLIKYLKENKLNIPVILTTAHNETEYLHEAIELKVEKYLVKPIVE